MAPYFTIPGSAQPKLKICCTLLYRPPSHTTGLESCSHTTGPDSHTARAVSAVSPIAELLDYASIAKNQLICPLTKKAASSSSLWFLHVNMHGQQPALRRVQSCQRAVSSKDTWHTSSYVRMCHLAWHVFRHRSLVLGLPAV
jgi:hypothetical protein